jgi:hypothetical protein
MRRGTVATGVPAGTIAAMCAAAAAAPRGAAIVARGQHRSCASFFSKSQIEMALGGQAAIKQGQVSPGVSFGAGAYGSAHYIRFAPGSTCVYDWVYPAGGSGFPVGDPDPSCSNISPGSWQVGWGATAKQWRTFRAAMVSDDPSALDSRTAQHRLRLGSGSHAFVETTPDYCTAASGYQAFYQVYVLTARRNVLEIGFWPSTLTKLTALVRFVLVHDKSWF